MVQAGNSGNKTVHGGKKQYKAGAKSGKKTIQGVKMGKEMVWGRESLKNPGIWV